MPRRSPQEERELQDRLAHERDEEERKRINSLEADLAEALGWDTFWALKEWLNVYIGKRNH